VRVFLAALLALLCVSPAFAGGTLTVHTKDGDKVTRIDGVSPEAEQSLKRGYKKDAANRQAAARAQGDTRKEPGWTGSSSGSSSGSGSSSKPKSGGASVGVGIDPVTGRASPVILLK